MGLFPLSCSNSDNIKDPVNEEVIPETPMIFYAGADLSYVNEMENCNAVFN